MFLENRFGITRKHYERITKMKLTPNGGNRNNTHTHTHTQHQLKFKIYLSTHKLNLIGNFTRKIFLEMMLKNVILVLKSTRFCIYSIFKGFERGKNKNKKKIKFEYQLQV